MATKKKTEVKLNDVQLNTANHDSSGAYLHYCGVINTNDEYIKDLLMQHGIFLEEWIPTNDKYVTRINKAYRMYTLE